METKNKKSSKFLIIIALVTVAALVVFRMVNLFSPQQQEKQTEVSVEITKAKYMDIMTTTPISGRVRPKEELNIVPLMQGKVTAVYAKIGDKVNAGQILFSIDASSFETQINQANEALSVAKSAYDRVQLLYSEGAIAYQDLEQAKLNYVNAQQAQIQAVSAYANSNVTSPISGYITAVNVNAGTLPPQASPAMVIADVSSLVVEAEISESIAANIFEGEDVQVKVDSVSSEPIKAKISSISAAPILGKMTYPVKIELGKAENVKAGMFAEIRIVNSKKKDVLCVPSQSVIIKDGTQTVAILREGKPKFVKVKIGIDNGEFVEIMQGLKENDIVISKGQHYVNEGEAVKVIKESDKLNE